MEGDVFNFEVATRGDGCVVRLLGELDVANAENVQRALATAQCSTIVVDLSTLTFVGSSGMTAIVHAHQELTRLGKSFELRGASGSVQRAFGLTGPSLLLGNT